MGHREGRKAETERERQRAFLRRDRATHLKGRCSRRPSVSPGDSLARYRPLRSKVLSWLGRLPPFPPSTSNLPSRPSEEDWLMEERWWRKEEVDWAFSFYLRWLMDSTELASGLFRSTLYSDWKGKARKSGDCRNDRATSMNVATNSRPLIVCWICIHPS